jgi:hypothetical protein
MDENFSITPAQAEIFAKYHVVTVQDTKMTLSFMSRIPTSQSHPSLRVFEIYNKI